MTMFYTITMFLSACSILYELVMAQTLSILAGNTVMWYSLTIGTYLGALGFGAMYCEKIFSKGGLWDSLFRVEIWISIAGGLSVIIVQIAQMIYSYHFLHEAETQGILLFLVIAMGMIFTIGFLSGLELPLLINIGNSISKTRPVTNRVLGFDYVGSLIGALLFPLILNPHLEAVTISLLVALINVLVALYIFRYASKRGLLTDSHKKMKRVVIVIGCLLFLLLNVMNIQQYFLRKYYYADSTYQKTANIFAHFSPIDHLPLVERYSSPYQKIDIVRSVSKDLSSILIVNAYSDKYKKYPLLPKDYSVYLNYDYQFNATLEELYHEYLVHIPIIISKGIPHEVLVIGGGDGLIIKELLKYSEIMKITHVDIDAKMVDLAKNHPVLKELNRKAFDDPRVYSLIEDGYQYVKNTSNRYDAIFIDLPVPKSYDLSRLYSFEFYYFIKKCLKEDGFVALDIPGRIQEIYHTIHAAGFQGFLPFRTILEGENEMAKQYLENAEYILQDFPDALIDEEYKAKLIEYLVHKASSVLREDFLMLKSKVIEGPFQYINYGVEKHVLNESRFNLSFTGPDYSYDKLSPRKINSIFRPTLPRMPIW